MSNLRRYYVNNLPVFLTIVSHDRQPILQTDNNKSILFSVINEVKKEKPFSLFSYVILNDHFHMIIQPKSTYTFSDIVQSMKLRFTYRFKKSYDITKKTNLWQQRFWDHVIRGENDFANHLDYIHYNPVKHGYTNDPILYPYSSLPNFIKRNYYPSDWGKVYVPNNIANIDFE